MTDDLEALFDEIAAQNTSSTVAKTTAVAPPPPKTADSSEDELEALFDEISEQQSHSTPPNTVTVKQPEAEPSDELEALFDEISAHTSAETLPVVTPVQTQAESAEDDLEALFNGIVEQNANQGASTVSATATEQVSLEGSQEEAEKPIYDRLGVILRQLHDSMRELGYDQALQETVSEVTDTKGRLEYVATLTEQAATRVLNSIDAGLPQQEDLRKVAQDIDDRWALLFDGNLSLEEFKQLAQDSKKFSAQAIDAAEQEKARLMEIMMAQDFQDITGQIIKKVVLITNKLEKELAQLLLDNAPAAVNKEKSLDLMSGPDVPAKALVQDDVDSLLATLGF